MSGYYKNLGAFFAIPDELKAKAKAGVLAFGSYKMLAGGKKKRR